jgi:hypothetical protein
VLAGNAVPGPGCDEKYRILEMQAEQGVHVSPEFGSCAWGPDTLWFDRTGALWMRFPPFSRFADEIEPGFVPGPPSTYVYRGGGRVESP